MRSGTVAYSDAGTAVAESFWSVSDWSPEDCTGFTLNTLPVPTALALPGFVAEAGAASGESGHQAGRRGDEDGRFLLEVGHDRSPDLDAAPVGRRLGNVSGKSAPEQDEFWPGMPWGRVMTDLG